MGASDFVGRILPTYGGPGAVEQWERLMRRVEPLGAAIFGLPAAAVREDAWAALTSGTPATLSFDSKRAFVLSSGTQPPPGMTHTWSPRRLGRYAPKLFEVIARGGPSYAAR